MKNSIFGGAFDFDNDGHLDTFEEASEMMALDRMFHREELENAGLDADELENMDEDERREALEEAGLDPDDFDF